MVFIYLFLKCGYRDSFERRKPIYYYTFNEGFSGKVNENCRIIVFK